MSVKLLQLNFKFNVAADDYRRAVSPMADDFAAVPGLLWKIWILNDQERAAGAIYLFENERAQQSFLSGPLAKQVMDHPALSDFSVKQFDVMAGPTAVTRGPIGVAARG